MQKRLYVEIDECGQVKAVATNFNAEIEVCYVVDKREINFDGVYSQAENNLDIMLAEDETFEIPYE